MIYLLFEPESCFPISKYWSVKLRLKVSQEWSTRTKGQGPDYGKGMERRHPLHSWEIFLDWGLPAAIDRPMSLKERAVKKPIMSTRIIVSEGFQPVDILALREIYSQH